MGRFWEYVKSHVQRPHGSRGVIMLGFAMVAFGFGTGYTWPGVLPPETFNALGTKLVQFILPLQIWGVAWYIAGVSLLTNAFRVEQGRAMGLITGLFTAWSLSHLNGFVLACINGTPNTGWLASLIYAGLVVACLGISRLPNPATTHKVIVDAPGEPTTGGVPILTGELPEAHKNGVDS